jgi:hypothetical protein
VKLCRSLNQSPDLGSVSSVERQPPKPTLALATGLHSTSSASCDKDGHGNGGQLTRRCSKCGSEKQLDQFHKKAARWDSRCKACVSKSKKARYRLKVKAKAYEESYTCVVKQQASEAVIIDFSVVLAESIQGLIDEGKI